MDGQVFELTVGAAGAVGTAGIVVTLMAWRTFRSTAFERAIVPLIVLFVTSTAYHALLLVYPPGNIDVEVMGATMYTAVTGFVLLMAYFQYRVDHPIGTPEPP